MRKKFKTNRQLVSLGFQPSSKPNKQTKEEIETLLQPNRVHMVNYPKYGQISINGRVIGVVSAYGLILN